MTDSDSLRGDIDRPHPNLPQCCGELEILRALLRPRMAEAGDPTPTEALRGMFIEIERLRVTTSEGARCQALEESLTAVKHTLQTLRGRLHELLQLSMDGASDRDIFERIESLKAKLAEERKRTNILAEEATAEGRLARAAANGHDHARALLVAIAEVFGRVDDLDSLPAKVRKIEAQRASLARQEAHTFQALTRLTTAIGNAAKEVGVLCEGRSALDILPDLLANMSHKTAFAAKYATERVQAHIEHAKNRVAEAEAALALLGWDRAQDMTTWARSSAQPVAAARWSAICEAFGFDPEEDPPASIPAILGGERWTNTRRMLADACANMRAPSLEVILGELVQTLSKARGANKRVDQALNVLGWSGADDPLEWAKEARRLADERIDVLQAELGVHAASIADAEIQTEKLAAALNEKTAALDVADAHISSLKSGSDEAHAALATLGWDGNSYPADWAKTTAAHYKAVREALGVPADKPIIPYAQHATKGMQALAILGWQDTHPVEWATKRAAAEADLRGAFAEAELVGSDHAAMVRQLWGNLRRTSAQHRAVIEERNAQIDECAVLRTVITERNARIHQLEIDNSKVHLEGRIELAEKRLSKWRAWAAGFCPMGFDASASDDSIIAALAFVPAAAYDREIKALQGELAHLRSLVSVMVDIKRRLVALKDLSP